jgi:hypothetical protein
MHRNIVREDTNMNAIDGFMEEVMKINLDALKDQIKAFQEDCYEEMTSTIFFLSVQSGINFLYALCTTYYISICSFLSRWNDLTD